MPNSWFNLNDANQNGNLIPRGTLAKVRLNIRPGGYNDPEKGWTGGYATRGPTGSVYLSCEFYVLDGPYEGHKIYSRIGLEGANGPQWGTSGRKFTLGIVNSARGLSRNDVSPQAMAARELKGGFADLDGLEFAARIDVGTDMDGDETNEIRMAITPDHQEYARVIGLLL